MHIMESINFNTYRSGHENRHYKTLNGYINNGEKVAFSLGLMRQPFARILDIGIGAGRTTAILRTYTNDYTGIDCVDAMVAMAQKQQPGVRLKTMDARDLSYFPDERFDLVFFSYNGLDAVHCDGRKKVLSEVSRVLAPDGAFVFSTFNKDWVGFGAHRAKQTLPYTPNPLRMAARLALAGVGLVRRSFYTRYEESGLGYAVRMHPAHHFGNMIHATTKAHLQQQLRESGFQGRIRYISKTGAERKDNFLPEDEYIHVVACKSPLEAANTTDKDLAGKYRVFAQSAE
jgi:ubiquinone/menaquinone biosynthesis C-methylase UbiE